MKKLYYFLFMIFMFLIFNVNVSAAEKVCIYNSYDENGNGNGIKADITIKDNGTIKSVGWIMKDNVGVGKYLDGENIGNDYSGDNCPKYALLTYGNDNGSKAKYYISDSKDELEEILNDKGYKSFDFKGADADTILEESINKGKVLAQIVEVEVEAEVEEEVSTITCTYSQEITGCTDCEITLEFWTSGKYYKVGESVVKSSDRIKGNITDINLVGEEWTKREYNTSLKQTTTPFTEYLLYNLCPQGIHFNYNETSGELNLYVNDIVFEEKYEESDPDVNIKYNVYSGELKNVCNEPGFSKSLRFIGYILYVVKIVIPILLIIFGTIDFGKAMIDSKPDDIQKTAKTYAYRVAAGVIIFFLPTVINFAFSLLPEGEGNFENCRTCLFNPNDCNITEDN